MMVLTEETHPKTQLTHIPFLLQDGGISIYKTDIFTTKWVGLMYKEKRGIAYSIISNV